MLKFFILIVSLNIFSQNNNVLKVEYYDYKIFKPVINKNKGELYVTDNYVFYKTDFLKNEKIYKNYDESAIFVDIEDKDFSEILIDRKLNVLTEYLYENLFLKKSFSVNEKTPKMKWELLSGEKKIQNFVCKKAKTKFRGRIYTVWYSEKIAVSFGPWKLNGLPGLILEAEDSEGLYKWEVKSIVYSNSNETISFDKIKKNNEFKKTSFKEFDRLKIEAINDKIKMIKARNANRTSMKVSFSYSTDQEREPINEFRSQMYFD
jgi:GLPGLI family protein